MPMYRQASAASAERELTHAVRRVVERYGSDLSAYFRDVKELAEKEKNAAADADVTDANTVESNREDQSAA
jgi:hypothetical protein